MNILKSALAATALSLTLPVLALATTAPDKGLGNLSAVGQEAIAFYQKLPGHKALAIADDGAVGYSSGVDSNEARIAALSRCAEVSEEKCRIISVDGKAVSGGTELGVVARTHIDAADLKGEVLADYEKAEGAKALAMSTDGAFGWVVRDSEEEARAAALEQCEERGQNCQIQASAALQ